jgi:hypothetical protein
VATRQACHQTHLRINAGWPAISDWPEEDDDPLEWRPVQDALSRDYDVIALDFPGFGGSAKLPANALPSAAALADAVEREMDQLGIGDFQQEQDALITANRAPVAQAGQVPGHRCPV